MSNALSPTTLMETYHTSGFTPRAVVEGYDHDDPAFVITFDRGQKKRHAAAAAKRNIVFMTSVGIVFGTWIVAVIGFISISSCVGSTAVCVAA
jgi:hypothetical protein